MIDVMPNTDNFFKYILTVGVLMILFGLVYPLKQEQLQRVKLIEIKEQDSLLRIEIKFLQMQADDLSTLQNRTQKKVDELKRIKKNQPISKQGEYDEKITSLVDNFYEKKTFGINNAHEITLKRAKLQYEQKRYIETEKQINEYFVFKSVFWGLGFILMLAGLFFWMDSTYFDERVKADQSKLHPPYSSKYVLCLSFLRKMVMIKYLWRIILLGIIFWIAIYFICSSR